MYLISITAAFPEPAPLTTATVHKDIEETLTKIQMHHCSINARLISTCPAMFRDITTASRRIFRLSMSTILPADSFVTSIYNNIKYSAVTHNTIPAIKHPHCRAVSLLAFRPGSLTL